MPKIIDDVVDETQSSALNGVAYGLGTGLGRNALGPLGHMAGGVAAGAYINDRTLSTLAIGEGVRMLINQGSQSGAQSSGRRRM